MKTSLHQELKQKANYSCLEQQVALQILRTAGFIEHSLSEGLKSFGLTTRQYNVLRILRGAGPSGLCRNAVGDRMLNPVPDATRLIDRLVVAGYARKDKDPVDRRYTTTRITRLGLELLEKLDEPVLEMHRAQLGHLSELDLQQLGSLLETARNNR